LRIADDRWLQGTSRPLTRTGDPDLQGLQAAGTRGAAMLAGAGEVKIHGSYVTVRAEIAAISNLSAHADYAEILAWLGNFSAPPRQTFITHGEPVAADALRRRIEERIHWTCQVPDYLQTFALTAPDY